MLPGFLIEEDGGGFFEAVEGGGGEGVRGFVGVDEEGEGAVLGFDLGVGDAGLEVEDGVAGGGLAARRWDMSRLGMGIRIELEGFEDTIDFGVLDC